MEESAATRPTTRRAWLWIAKLAVTAALIAFIVWHTDWAQFLETARRANVLLLAVVLGLMVLSVTISTVKWKLLLSILGVELPFNRLHRWYFIGVFYNNFLPSSIGGDGYRIFKTLDSGERRAAAVVAVFVERVSGVVGLLAICYVSALVIYLRDGDALSRNIVVACTLGGLLVLVVLALLDRTHLIERISRHPRCPGSLKTLFEMGSDFRAQPVRCIWVGVVTILFHFHQIFFFWLLIYAFGTTASIFEVAVMQALISILGILPVTINGLGLVDGSFAGLARYYGLGFEVGLAVILVVRVFNMVVSLVGAGFILGDRAQARGGMDASSAAALAAVGDPRGGRS